MYQKLQSKAVCIMDLGKKTREFWTDNDYYFLLKHHKSSQENVTTEQDLKDV